MTDRDPSDSPRPDPGDPSSARPSDESAPPRARPDPFELDDMLPDLEGPSLPQLGARRSGEYSASGEYRHDSGLIAKWEAGASEVTFLVIAAAVAMIVGGYVRDIPVLLSTGIAVLLLGVVANRVVDWVDEGDGTMRGAIANRAADLWDTSLGSFYGVMTFIRFVQLEVATLIGEFAEAGSIGEVLQGEILTGFSIQSLSNSISAALWPIDWITRWGFWAILGIGLGAKVWDTFHDWIDERLGRHPALPPDPDAVDPDGAPYDEL